MSTWLQNPGPILLKRHVRSSKYEPIVDEVELIHATPSYARVRMPNGGETTVSLRDVAPGGNRRVLERKSSQNSEHFVPIDKSVNEADCSENRNFISPEPRISNSLENEASDNSFVADDVTSSESPEPQNLRRSTRTRRPPERFTYDRDHIR